MNQVAKVIRCALYGRKSNEEGLGQAFNSLDAQRLAAENYIASQQHEGYVALSKVYDDGGYSGGNLNRPALQELFRDIEQGLVDCVVVYKIDRLSRSLLDFAHIVELFDKHQVSFVAVTQSFNTSTSMGRLMLNVLLSFAQYERELTGERIRDKVAASKQKGYWMGGHPPLGYDIQNRSLVINALEAPMIKNLFQRFLVLKSLTRLAQEFNEAGYRTKRHLCKDGSYQGNQLLTKAHLRRTVTNPIYKGYVSHKGAVYPGLHEAIVSEELWAQAQEVFQKSAHVRSRENASDSLALLKSIIFCKVCNVAMTPTYCKKKGKQYHYYTCSNHLRGKTCASWHKNIASGEVESFVVKQVRAILSSPEIIAKTLQILKGSISEEQAIATLQKMDVMWENLFPAEQKHILWLLVKEVGVYENGIDIRLHQEGLPKFLSAIGLSGAIKDEH